jgi:hypothetical protein
MVVKFKHTELAEQFNKRLDPRLTAIIADQAVWCLNELKKELIITCVNRTLETNKAVGGKPLSAHLFGRAVDIRSRIYNEEDVKKFVHRLLKVWGGNDKERELMLCVVHHDSGAGEHIHVSINRSHWRGDFA